MPVRRTSAHHPRTGRPSIVLAEVQQTRREARRLVAMARELLSAASALEERARELEQQAQQDARRD